MTHSIFYNINSNIEFSLRSALLLQMNRSTELLQLDYSRKKRLKGLEMQISLEVEESKDT